MLSSRTTGSDNWRNKDVTQEDQALTCQPYPRRSQWQERNHREMLRRIRKEWKAQEEPAREVAEGTRVYVGNMPYVAQKMDVEALFKAFGFDVLNIDISIDPSPTVTPRTASSTLAPQTQPPQP